MILAHKVNRIKVQVIPKDIIPAEFIKGYEVFDEPYANIYILAKKNSGKTTVEFNIIKKCANKNTTIIFFAGQLYKDASYKYIVKWLKDRNYPVVLNNSLFDDEGKNQLAELLDHLKNEYKDEFDDEDESEDESMEDYPSTLYGQDEDDEEEMPPNSKIKPSKRRKLAPDYIFVFDDLSGQIRNSTQIAQLLKENRHYKSKVIICSQYLNDLKPEVIENLDYLLMFKKIPFNKVEEAREKLNLGVSKTLFRSIYRKATEKLHHFLYIDIKKDKFRQNFDMEMDIPEENE